MRFEEVLEIWNKRDITQEEAARMLCVSDRTFRRYIDRYEEEGLGQTSESGIKAPYACG